jgi:hypothetical protein
MTIYLPILSMLMSMNDAVERIFACLLLYAHVYVSLGGDLLHIGYVYEQQEKILPNFHKGSISSSCVRVL